MQMTIFGIALFNFSFEAYWFFGTLPKELPRIYFDKSTFYVGGTLGIYHLELSFYTPFKKKK